MADKGIIYKYTNNINGNSYIGQTVNPNKRIQAHKYYAFRKKLDNAFYRALRKYGWNNFTYTILETVNVNELNDREIFWINYYNTYYNGYNETFGGNSQSGFHHSDKTRKKISEIQKGKVSPNKGKKLRPHTNEEKQKVSKIVYQYSLDGTLIKIWKSTAECGKNGFNQGHVAAVCRGDEKTHKGFIFKYDNENTIKKQV